MRKLLALGERLIDAAAIAAFCGIFLCVIAQVVLRYVFNNPLTWSEELARYLFIWCAFLGWLVATRRGSHLAMTFVVERLPRPAQAALAVLTQLATLLFAWLLGSRGFLLVRNNWDVENVAVPFNLGVVYLIEPIAAAVIALYALAALGELLRGAASRAHP
ncbi:MAG: TRAP transporter small permease [Burkholderiales bacterium]|nr:TRAP transporter small permease [Burkholderiales bacterium]